MAKKTGGLGKGLDVLFGQSGSEYAQETPAVNSATEVDILSIDPNPYQPRQDFDKETLKELAESIKTHGLLQPILVSANGKRFYIIAGERRWRASKLAGLKKIPVHIVTMDEKGMAEAALIENLQREDLNPIEEAEGIRHYMKSFSLTQAQAAERLGKSRSVIANSVRILSLPDEIRTMVRDGRLSSGHAKVLAGIQDHDIQLQLARKAVSMELSVRQLEGMCRSALSEKPPKEKKRERRDPELNTLCNMLRDMMGTKVTIKGNTVKGKIVLDYYSAEDLERIYELAQRVTGQEQ